MSIEDNLESNAESLMKNNLRALTAIANSKNSFYYLKEYADTEEYEDLNHLTKPDYRILIKSGNPTKTYYSFIMTRLGKEKLKEIIAKIKNQP